MASRFRAYNSRFFLFAVGWLRVSAIGYLTRVRFAKPRNRPPPESGLCVRIALVAAPPANSVCDSCVDDGFASSLGVWAPNSSAPFRCHVRCALEAAEYREAAAADYEYRCDLTWVRKDISAVRQGVAELRRASPIGIRGAPRRVKKHLAPANATGLEDVLGEGSDAPSDGASSLLITAQFSGPCTQAEKVAMESADRIRLSRAPHMRYKF